VEKQGVAIQVAVYERPPFSDEPAAFLPIGSGQQALS
jgi:hypothetical protein